MAKCENCGARLDHKNKSPSEIHDLCITCWLSHSESESLRRYFELRNKTIKNSEVHDIEPFTPPLIKEILAQQRIILEINKELFKMLAYPSIIYKEKANG